MIYDKGERGRITLQFFFSSVEWNIKLTFCNEQIHDIYDFGDIDI